jgi:hypothetical protein
MVATSTLVRYEDPLEVRERGAVAGFLAGYSGNPLLFIGGAPSGGFCSPVNDPVDRFAVAR